MTSCGLWHVYAYSSRLPTGSPAGALALWVLLQKSTPTAGDLVPFQNPYEFGDLPTSSAVAGQAMQKSLSESALSFTIR